MTIIYQLLAFIASALFTYSLRTYAIKKNIYDVPNIRSSHSVPTPRGGGVAIVVVFLLALSSYGLSSMPNPVNFNQECNILDCAFDVYTPFLMMVAGILVAFIGWLDDHGHVRSGIRFAAHLSGSAIIVFAIGGLPAFELFGYPVNLDLYGGVLGVIGLTWLLNLYNFMDGIDGIAGVEAVTTSGIAGLILFHSFGLHQLANLHFMLTAASLGFLVWNFPSAKIFMGDAGSGFLGLMLGALMLYSASLASSMLWIWMILLGVFIVDATYTLCRRLLRGDRVYEAHRSHAYQHAARYYGSHKIVTMGVLLINIIWLAPIAYLVAADEVNGAMALLIAYTPLVFLAWKFKAGELERADI